jgi:heme-degrading monooxygenase HmoA
MHARLNRIEGAPDRFDESARRTEEVVLPLLRELDGFQGLTVLGDRSSGTFIAISFWESANAMQASEGAVKQPRKEAADAAEARSEATVERYEVLIQS